VATTGSGVTRGSDIGGVVSVRTAGDGAGSARATVVLVFSVGRATRCVGAGLELGSTGSAVR
jgi:hypothetical protein